MKDEMEYKGYTIEIVPDENAESPDSDEHLFLATFHRDFTVNEYNLSVETVQAAIDGKKVDGRANPMWAFPLYAYIHSGVALSLERSQYPFTDQWDVSTVGAVMVSKKEFRTRKQAYKIAESYVETWNQYLSGDIYGYIVKFDDDEIDSCWGFYGREYCEKSAKDVVAGDLAQRASKEELRVL